MMEYIVQCFDILFAVELGSVTLETAHTAFVTRESTRCSEANKDKLFCMNFNSIQARELNFGISNHHLITAYPFCANA
jgi:hypothetical protein